jgi:hypothetical protein
MKRNSLALALAGVLALAGLAAHAESPDPSGQYAVSIASTRTRSDVLAELQQFKRSGVNPWSIRYNQLAGFRSTRTQADVRAEFLANRDETKAMTSEDSGAAYLASHKPAEAPRQLAGRPFKAE